MTAEIVLALLWMLGIMAWVIRGSRPLRGGQELHARTWSFLRRYEDRSLWPSLILGALALGTLFDDGRLGNSVFVAGVVLGLFCGWLWRPDTVGLVDSGLAFICAMATLSTIAEFADGPPGTIGYRYLMLGLLSACYLFGALRGGHSRLISARRFQVYFAIVDIVAFMASPGGADLRDVELWRQFTYLGVTCVACFLLGLFDVDIVVVLMAAAVTVTDVALTVNESWNKPLVAMLALVVAGFVRLRKSSTSGVSR
ncbi:hypothetical protein ACQPYH_22470 [Kribbella sp. CA-245084]|uniref:hypothetical protein n=1 Tax=Kribbella sp. CA-245084 TaxID=3239940 RepID=UPI003D8F3493